MRHPFDGINQVRTTNGPAGPNRRSLLRWFAAASALLVSPWRFARRAAADEPSSDSADPQDALQAKLERVEKFRQYYVVAASPRGFGMARRKELGIPGSHRVGWPSRPELKNTRGYVAWMTTEQAEQLEEDPAISAVHELAAADTLVTGEPSSGPTEIIVSLYPNGFRDEVPDDNYFTNKELMATLSPEIAGHDNVKVVTGMKGYKLYIWVKSGEVPADLLNSLKENHQVYHVNFTGRPTTMMLGEEGGRPPGNVR